MLKRHLIKIYVLLLPALMVAWLLTGCTAQAEPVTASATVAAASTSPATPTPSPRPSSTSTSTPLPSATETQTASPTATVGLVTPPPPAEDLGTSQQISPDGRWTAITKYEQPAEDADYRITFQVIAQDGTQTWTLMDESSSGLGYTAPRLIGWSDDSLHLYFSKVQVPDGCSSPFAARSTIQVIDVASGRVEDVTTPKGFEHSISPDENTMAYIQTGDPVLLVLRDMENRTEQYLPLPIEATGAGEPEAGAILWAPDSSALVLVAASGELCGQTAPLFSLQRVDIGGLVVVELTPWQNLLIHPLKWSGDGRILVRDWDNRSWWIDAGSGAPTTAP